MLGKIEGRRRGQQRMRWLDGMTDSIDMFEQALGVGDGQGSPLRLFYNQSSNRPPLVLVELWRLRSNSQIPL